MFSFVQKPFQQKRNRISISSFLVAHSNIQMLTDNHSFQKHSYVIKKTWLYAYNKSNIHWEKPFESSRIKRQLWAKMPNWFGDWIYLKYFPWKENRHKINMQAKSIKSRNWFRVFHKCKTKISIFSYLYYVHQIYS